MTCEVAAGSVADPDPDPGIFPQSGSRNPDPGKKKHIFKGNNKILGEIFVFNQKSRYHNLLNREL